MASDVATMQPTMILKPDGAGRLGQGERLGQSAGLVELDVDGVVAIAKPIQVVCAYAAIYRRTPGLARRI